LVATIEIDVVRLGGHHAGAVLFDVHLCKPVTPATLFGIITYTPVFCYVHIFQRAMADPQRDEFSRVVPMHKTYDAYRFKTSEPALCRLQKLRNVTREDTGGAGLIRGDGYPQSWKTNIQLDQMRFTPTLDGELEQRDGDTLFELMKLTGRQRKRSMKRESEVPHTC
jgi:hypothetical protein